MVVDDQIKSHIQELNIQEFRLMNGDHIMAEILIDEDSSGIVLKDPIEIAVNGDGYRTFAEWFVFTDNQYFVIDSSTVVASGEVDYLSKLLFCKMVLTRSIKNKLLSGMQSDLSELEYLKQLQLLISETTSRAKMPTDEGVYYDNISTDERSTNHTSAEPDWANLVDTSIKH